MGTGWNRRTPDMVEKLYWNLKIRKHLAFINVSMDKIFETNSTFHVNSVVEIFIFIFRQLFVRIKIKKNSEKDWALVYNSMKFKYFSDLS